VAHLRHDAIEAVETGESTFPAALDFAAEAHAMLEISPAPD
jgi:hypothetical protein